MNVPSRMAPLAAPTPTGTGNYWRWPTGKQSLTGGGGANTAFTPEFGKWVLSISSAGVRKAAPSSRAIFMPGAARVATTSQGNEVVFLHLPEGSYSIAYDYEFEKGNKHKLHILSYVPGSEAGTWLYANTTTFPASGTNNGNGRFSASFTVSKTVGGTAYADVATAIIFEPRPTSAGDSLSYIGIISGVRLIKVF